MPDSLPLPADIVLRLVGAFYIFAAPLIIRAGATNLLLNRAISAISLKVSEADRVEEKRVRFLALMALLTAAGGILLAARLDLAVWAFLANAAVYALYLFVLAPRFFDPWDEPDDNGRRQTRNAFLVYLAATAIVAAAWWSDALRPFADEHPTVLGLCAAAFAAICAYAWRSFRQARGVGAGAVPTGTTAAAAEADHPLPERLVVTPSWHGTGLVDAETGSPVFYPYGLLSDEISGRLDAWLDLFRDIADPDDPWRCAVKDPANLARLEAAGRPIHEALLAQFGPDRLVFEPAARPCPSATAFAAVKVAAGFETDPVWDVGERDGGYEYSCSAHHIGVSWRLAEDLLAWGRDYDASFADGDPEGRRLWTPAEAASHRDKGLALTRRLAVELAATGRGHVPVWYQAENEAAVRVSA